MKRFLSILCILALCFSSFSVFAARDTSFEENLAKDLKSLGLFRGVSDTDFALDREPTRLESLVMLIRVLGKEKEAEKSSYQHPFIDVPDWANPYVGYAYTHQLSKGTSDTTFGNENASAAMYLTFILRALGYSDGEGEDFLWDNPFPLAEKIGILPAAVNKTNFLRADVVLVSYASLGANLKGTSKSLGEKLIGEKVFSKKDFESLYNPAVLENYIPKKQELSPEEIYQKCSPAVFYIEVYDKDGYPQGSGSGFFIDDKGTAVTNYHVIEGMSSAIITHSVTQQEYSVEGVYDFNQEQDWAILKVNGSGFDFLTPGDASTIIGGAKVYAIGSPMGLQNTISEGLISNTNRVLDGLTYIQTSAPISHGSSGGAFLNKYGEVIGITSAGFTDGENLGLAIPISVIREYSTDSVTTLHDLAYPAPPSIPSSSFTDEEQDSLTAEQVLMYYISKTANDRDEDTISCTQTFEDEDSIISYTLSLDNDGTLSIATAYMSDTINSYLSIDLNDPEDRKFVFYTYEDISEYFLIAYDSIDAKSVTKDSGVIFTKYEGTADYQELQPLIDTMTDISLATVNIVLEQFSDIFELSHPLSVADFGFVNF